MIASAPTFPAPFGAGPAIAFTANSFHAVITAGLAAAGAWAPPEAGSAAIKPTLTTSANIERVLIGCLPSLADWPLDGPAARSCADMRDRVNGNYNAVAAAPSESGAGGDREGSSEPLMRPARPNPLASSVVSVEVGRVQEGCRSLTSPWDDRA